MMVRLVRLLPHRRMWLVWVAAVATMVAGCGLNPVKMSAPRTGGSDTYQVVVDFSSALNLPAGAKVTYEGDRIGAVRSVELANGVVAVTTSLNASARIPGDATAAIVQDTILGDSYVSINKPAEGAGSIAPLVNGSRIPVSRTKPPNAVEDMLTTVASFLGSGSVQNMQTMTRRINAALPRSNDETRKVAGALARDLRSLADNTSDLSAMVFTLEHMSVALKNNIYAIDDIGSAESADLWNKLWTAIAGVVGVMASMGNLVGQGSWLVPTVESVSTALEQTGAPGSGTAIDNFTNQTLLPFLMDPNIQITDVVTPDGTSRTADTRRVLAMLGALR